MSTVSIRELRHNWKGILRRLEQGEQMVLVIHGHRVARLARLEPIQRDQRELPSAADPAYRLYEFAERGGASLSNEEIDEIVLDDPGSRRP